MTDQEAIAMLADAIIRLEAGAKTNGLAETVLDGMLTKATEEARFFKFAPPPALCNECLCKDNYFCSYACWQQDRIKRVAKPKVEVIIAQEVLDAIQC